MDNVTEVETIVLGSGSDYSYILANAFAADTTNVTINAAGLIAGDDLTLDLMAVDNRGIAVTLSSALGSDTITVDTTMANLANVHTVANLGAGDQIIFGTAGTRTITVELATFNIATFAGSVNTYLQNIGYVAAADDVILVRIGGSDSNLYAISNDAATAFDFVDSADVVIHLTGTITVPLDGGVWG